MNVVDPSFESELLDEEQQQEHDRPEQDCNNDAAAPEEEDTHQNSDVDVDAEYYKVAAAAKRACIVLLISCVREKILIGSFMDVMLPSSSAQNDFASM